MNKVRADVWSAVVYAVWEAVRPSSVRDAVWYDVRYAVRDAVWSAVWPAVGNAVREAVREGNWELGKERK